MKLSELGGAFFSIVKNEIQEVRSALWFRPAAFCFAAIVLAVLVATIDGFLPKDALSWLPDVEVSSLRDLLNLLTASMLTVSTVTLSVLMLVLSLAAGQASPRAVPEVMADPVTQNALGSFLATFVFSLTALLLLGSGGLSGPGVTLTFFFALALIMNAIRYLVQWIHHVAETMKLNRIVKRIHGQAEQVLQNYLAKGEEEGETPAKTQGEGATLCATQTGYVQFVDESELCSLAEEHGLILRLAVREGDFLHPYRPVMQVWGGALDGDEEESRNLASALRLAVVVGYERSPENDPLLGVELLAEVASRALSPGINDPQSALVALEFLGALLAEASVRPEQDYPAPCLLDQRVALRRVAFSELLQRALRPVMRDGAGFAEVIHRIVALLEELAETAAPEYLESLAGEAERAQAFGKDALALDRDKQALGETVEKMRRSVEQRAP